MIEFAGEMLTEDMVAAVESECPPEELYTSPFDPPPDDKRYFKAGMWITTTITLKDGRVLQDIVPNTAYKP